MTDISVVGSQIHLVASVTLPTGYTFTEFADDVDPWDVPSLQLAETASGANGDLVSWSKANPLKTTLALIPNGDDDRIMSTIAEANRVAKGKLSALDIITVNIIHPDGSIDTYSKGKLTDAIIGKPMANAGRFKTKTYAFAFEGFSST